MRTMVLAIATVALACALPGDVHAQTPAEGEWWAWALPSLIEDGRIRTPEGTIALPPIVGERASRRGGDWERRDRDFERRRRGRRVRARAGGPPFCRNGEGHPVFGLEWCRRKGFGGYARWERVGWEDVIFDRPRRYPRRGTVDRGGLIDILGDIVFSRLQRHRARIGADGRIRGRWYGPERSGAAVLQLRAGSVPLAELTDADGDGHVDVILLNSGR